MEMSKKKMDPEVDDLFQNNFEFRSDHQTNTNFGRPSMNGPNLITEEVVYGRFDQLAGESSAARNRQKKPFVNISRTREFSG